MSECATKGDETTPGPRRRKLSVRWSAARYVAFCIAVICSTVAAARSGASPVIVVMSAGVSAYQTALGGLTDDSAGAADFRVVTVGGAASGEKLSEELAEVEPRLIVPVGSHAMDVVRSAKPSTPVIGTMLLHGHSVSLWPSSLSVVTLEAPPALFAAHLKRLFPSKKRLGVIYSSGAAHQSREELARELQREGYEVVIAECDEPAALLPTLSGLRGRVDFVWCRPNAMLYNSTTIKPLIRRSLELRLPIVGFSEAFARSGAAVGIYADFYDIGRQTAALVAAFDAGSPLSPVNPPRSLKTVVNQRVIRLLGLRMPKQGGPEVKVLR